MSRWDKEFTFGSSEFVSATQLCYRDKSAERGEIESLMAQFLKRRKIKKIKRGKSGLTSQWYKDHWGFMA